MRRVRCVEKPAGNTAAPDITRFSTPRAIERTARTLRQKCSRDLAVRRQVAYNDIDMHPILPTGWILLRNVFTTLPLNPTNNVM